MDLELRHLRIILTLADELSFSRAADRLGLPQSALSSQLVRIEKTIGVRLFNRTTRSVLPTAAADLLLPLARAAAAAGREFEDGARTLRTDTALELRVAADSSLIGSLSAALRRAEPEPHTVYSVSEGGTALAAVCGGTADLAWGYDYPTRPFRPTRQVRCATVGVDPMWIALPATHRLAGEHGIRLDDLAGESWVGEPAGTEGHEYLIELCHAAGFRPDIRCTTGSLTTVPELVGAGAACVALASPFTRLTPAIRMVPLLPSAGRRTVLAWHPARCPTTLAEAVHCDLSPQHQGLVADPLPTATVGRPDVSAP